MAQDACLDANFAKYEVLKRDTDVVTIELPDGLRHTFYFRRE